MHYGRAFALTATLTLTPVIWLGAWGSKLPLWAQTTASVIALGGASALIPLARSLDEDIKTDRADLARRHQLQAGYFAASTEAGLKAIRQQWGIGGIGDRHYAGLLQDMAEFGRVLDALTAQPQTATPPAPDDSPPLADFDSILDEGTGIAILGNSGSGKSSVARYLVGLMGAGTQVIVLDPHNDDCWGDLPVVWQIDQIERQLRLLMEELQDRKAHRRREPKVAVICDEWPAVRLEIKRTADEYILRAGSEFRKFGMLNLFCSQSGNVGALGLEGRGDFLENYTLIRLNKIALKYARNLPDQRILKTLKQQAYCCLVNDDLSRHPTHAHYDRVKDGNIPANLRSLRPAPLTIPNVFDLGVMGGVGVSPSTEPAPLTPLQHQGSEANTGVASDPLSEDISPQERGAVIQFHRMGYSQTETIRRVWGVTKGTSAKYQICRAKYRQVLGEIGAIDQD